MFPQRNRMLQQQYQQYQSPQQMMGYPQRPPRRGLFGGASQRGFQSPTTQVPMQHYQQPQRQGLFPYQQQVPAQQAPKQSIFRNEQGQIDFQKIGGGVQTAMGLVNQVSPMMKMLGGFLK